MKLALKKTMLTVLCVSAALACAGCSRQYLMARIYLYRAGQVFYKTDNHLRRIKKLPFDERKKHYGGACMLYFKAFQTERRVFNLDEIEHALQCCESAENQQVTGEFQDFYAAYQAAHPVESEYGLVPVGGVQEG